MELKQNDGGRAAAGLTGRSGDCVTRAISIATGKDYKEVAAALDELAKSERTGKRKRSVSNSRDGVYRTTYDRYLKGLGWKWTPTMKIGSGCTVHLKADELPAGRLIVSVSKHMVAVIDGVVHDVFDPTRGGTRCVYGYFSAPVEETKRTSPHSQNMNRRIATAALLSSISMNDSYSVAISEDVNDALVEVLGALSRLRDLVNSKEPEVNP